MKKLIIKKLLERREIVHHAGGGRIISSFFNKIFIQENNVLKAVSIPLRPGEFIPGLFRLSRRALRLDKCNVFPVGNDLVVIRGGSVYHYECGTGKIGRTLGLRNCRNVLHQSISATPDGQIYFGEYGGNKTRRPVPVYRSRDAGRSWETVYEFAAGSIKHVHGCYYDKHEDAIWTCTGDFTDENKILVSNRDFSKQEWIGDGGQKFRTCNFFFTPDSVHWLMDSQLEQSHHVKLDRKTRRISIGQPVPGPVWYIKQLADGYFLAATAQEIGPGVKDEYAHLLISRDLENWEDLHLFQHDGWSKRYFKFGVIGFADGEQTSRDFYMFFEALRGFDGRAALCEITDDNER